MADCGASGSALDRVARAMSSGNNEASKHAASLLGHASMRSNPMPTMAPDRLVLPSQSSQMATPPFDVGAATAPGLAPSVMAPLAPSQMLMPRSVEPHPVDQPHHPMQQMTRPHPQQQMMHPQHDPQLHMHQQHMMAQAQAQQQYHNMMMMHQHQQHVMTKGALTGPIHCVYYLPPCQGYSSANRKQAAQRHATAQQSSTKQSPKTSSSDYANDWHVGLDEARAQAELDQLKKHLEEEDAMLGHEGIVHGATMEELAAAWAQTEAEYENVEDATNLWSGASAQAEESAYEFLNKEAPPPDVDQQDWMKEGMTQFEAGNIKEAIRAFEMELQHVDPDNATAWRMLGRCHAENDMDREAIVCLEQAVERDPYSPEALLALGVSYVNELNHTRAIETLRAWIQNNPKFAGLELPNDVYGAKDATAAGGMEADFDQVQQLLLHALDFSDASSSADVLEALGVVYNVSRDYDAAVDAFHKAIEARPGDYQLWNKLGATLANGNQSEKALPAYHKALQLKPKYARAWLNMAIAHSNLQNYDEAARCYLQTLSLNPSAVHCWSYLRIALSCSERWDLIPFAASQDLAAFSELYDFVMYNGSSSASTNGTVPKA